MSATRYAVAALLTVAAGASCGVLATPLDDCNADDPEIRIAGCSAVLEGSIDPKSRAVALVRRGEALEKRGDLGGAVVDFIAAAEADPRNFYAQQDLRRLLPRRDPHSEADAAAWPPLVEGVAFPRGFEPTLERDVARAGGDYHSFAPPSGDWRFCRAACFADTQCRAWEFRPAAPSNTGSTCSLKARVAERAPASGVVSGVIRPEQRIMAAPAYRFIDGEAFGLRPAIPRTHMGTALLPIKAAAFPTTGPYGVKPPRPHPLLTSYTAHALYRGALCEVTGMGSGLRSEPNTATLLRELVAAFGRPASSSTSRRYVWISNGALAEVTLEAGPTVTIRFANHRDCEAQESALSDLRHRLRGAMPTEKDLAVR